MEILRSDGTLESAHEAIWIERHSGFAGYSDKRASGFKAFADLDARRFVELRKIKNELQIDMVRFNQLFPRPAFLDNRRQFCRNVDAPVIVR